MNLENLEKKLYQHRTGLKNKNVLECLKKYQILDLRNTRAKNTLKHFETS